MESINSVNRINLIQLTRALMPDSRLVNVTLVLLFMFTSGIGQAEVRPHFELTPDLREYYSHILMLDWESADSISELCKSTDANNALVVLFDNYSVITRLLIRDNEIAFNELKSLKEDYLKKIRKADKRSPFYRYVKAEILLQWSILNYKYDNRFTAFTDVWTAYKLLEENLELHPEFISTRRSLGLLRAFMGTMPLSESMKWFLKQVSGMSGTIDEGLADIHRVIDYGTQHDDYIFHDECKALYAYLQLHLKNQPEAAWESIQGLSRESMQSPMAGFAKANLALKTGRLENCIQTINSISEEERIRLPFNYFIKGKAELYLGNPDSRKSFGEFLKLHEGESYRYAAYQKMAWSYLIDGDEQNYRWHMDQCLPERHVFVGEDKDAFREAHLDRLPVRFLLKARLYYDGHQYHEALAVLERNLQLGSHPSSALEYYYRLGRVFQGLDIHDQAISALTRSYDIGFEDQAYYACNAALQIGLIQEQNSNIMEASLWFGKCLDMKPDAYRKSLHHKAKAGLKRIGK